MPFRSRSTDKDYTATPGFEAKLWLPADKLRNNMDAVEYKNLVLGLIFLKYISDSFDEHWAKLAEGKGDYAVSDPENKNDYEAAHVFWVPAKARWSCLRARAESCAKDPKTGAVRNIGQLVDDAMTVIERETIARKFQNQVNVSYV